MQYNTNTSENSAHMRGLAHSRFHSSTSLRLMKIHRLHRCFNVVYSVFFIALLMLESDIHANDPAIVSIVQLLAKPEAFDGKRIVVIGYLDLKSPKQNEAGFHGSDVLYLHQEDSINSLFKNGLAIVTKSEVMKNSARYNRQYVSIRGTFDAKKLGYMNLYSGTISEIEGIILWKDITEGNRIPVK
jgi:hypothetical protein